MIFPRPRVREKSARPSLSETETTEQNHATGIRIECHTRAVSRRRAVIAAAIGPVSSVERPGVIDEPHLIDKSAEENYLVIHRIVRHRRVVTRWGLMRRLQSRPVCSVETPGIVQYSVRSGMRVAAEKDHRFRVRIVDHRRARPRRRRLRRLQPIPARPIKTPGIVQDADRIVAAENDELRIGGIKRNTGVLPFAQRGRAELTPV